MKFQIFAQAYSKFIICLVGADGKKKIVLSSDQFETASFEQLRFLYENATLNHNTNGDGMFEFYASLGRKREAPFSIFISFGNE